MQDFNEEMKKEQKKPMILMNIRVTPEEYVEFKKVVKSNELNIATVVRGLMKRYTKGEV